MRKSFVNVCTACMTVLVPVNWHLYAWQQGIAYNVQVISKDVDKVWLKTGQHWQYHAFNASVQV